MTMTNETRRAKAVDAAYSEWGRRHYRLIIGWQMAVKYLPYLLALAGAGLVFAGVVWAFGHLTSPKAPKVGHLETGNWLGVAIALGATVLIVAVIAAINYFSPGAFYSARRKAFAALAAVGGAALVWLWRGST